jgi:hypothetical protein
MSERIALITGVTGQDGAYLAEYLRSPCGKAGRRPWQTQPLS